MIKAILSGKSLERFQEQRPDWFEWLIHSVVIERQGVEAAKLYNFPVDDKEWQASMMLLSFMWKELDVQLGMGGSAAMASITAMSKAFSAFTR